MKNMVIMILWMHVFAAKIAMKHEWGMLCWKEGKV